MSNTNSNLQTLTTQYNSVLNQYQTIYELFINSLKATVNAETSGNTDFKSSPQTQMYQAQLQKLNAQLIDINNKMIILIGTSEDSYQKNIKAEINTHKKLGENYSILLDERKNIDSILNDYQTISQKIESTDYYTTETYTRYIILLGITIILFFLLFKYAIISNNQTGGGTDRIKSDIIFLLCVMIVFLGLANIFKNISMLIFLTIIIILYLFIKIKMVSR
jgi:hypothetical protein